MSHRLRPLSLLGAVALVVGSVACSSTPPSQAALQADAGPTPPDAGFQHDVVLTMKLPVPAQQELHQCQFVQIPGGADMNVTGFAHEFTPGSHHFLLYETTLTEIPPDMTGQYDCTEGNEPIMSHAKNIIYGSQVPSGAFAFPPGVAVTLPASSVLIINTHYLNLSPNDIDTTVQVGLDSTTADAVTTQGGFFIFYDPFIDIPASASASSGGRCPVPQDVTIMSAFTHYHYRGKDMKVWLDPGQGPKATSTFYATSDWEHPAPFVGPVTWAGSSSVRFQCDYVNPTTEETFQGPNAMTSEMCVFAGLYYPKQSEAFEHCDALSTMGFGTNACVSTASCLGACPSADAPVRTPTNVLVGPCWQHCVASACDGAVDTALPLLGCAGSQCATECAMGTATCTDCLSANCSDVFSACVSQTCP
jgi:hypothetical protein